MRIQGATIFDGINLLPDGSIKVSADGLIEAINRIPSADETQGTGVDPADVVELDGGYLCPGFVDLQVNGGGGVMFNDEPSVATLRCMAQAHLSLGTTSFLPTLITDQSDKVSKAVAAVEQAIADEIPASPDCIWKVRI